MQRPSPWLMSLNLLLGNVLLREPHFGRAEDFFLRWFRDHLEPETRSLGALTVIEIARVALVGTRGRSGPSESPVALPPPIV